MQWAFGAASILKGFPLAAVKEVPFETNWRSNPRKPCAYMHVADFEAFEVGFYPQLRRPVYALDSNREPLGRGIKTSREKVPFYFQAPCNSLLILIVPECWNLHMLDKIAGLPGENPNLPNGAHFTHIPLWGLFWQLPLAINISSHFHAFSPDLSTLALCACTYAVKF